jgi:peptide deformylase
VGLKAFGFWSFKFCICYNDLCISQREYADSKNINMLVASLRDNCNTDILEINYIFLVANRCALPSTLLFSNEDEAVKYVGDKKKLSRQCKPCESIRHGKILGDRLLKIMKEQENAAGLAANQVGVDVAVCAVNVIEPIILINPKIINQFGKSFFQEACLSFPGDYILTERWTNVMVTSDNHSYELIFSFEKSALECVCVQHEIDHLNGVTMFDRAVDMEKLNGKN